MYNPWDDLQAITKKPKCQAQEAKLKEIPPYNP